MATGCRLLILDEPTNALNIPAKSQFRRLLAGAAADDRVIVVSTHQVRDLEHLIDPIVVLEQGAIVFQHSVAESMHDSTVFSVARAWYALRADLYQQSRAGLVAAGAGAAVVLVANVASGVSALEWDSHAVFFPLALLLGARARFRPRRSRTLGRCADAPMRGTIECPRRRCGYSTNGNPSSARSVICFRY